MRLTRVLLWLLLALLIGAIAVPIASLFAPFPTFRAGQLGASLWVAAGLCFVSLGCAATYERGKLRRLMVSGLIAAGAATAIWTAAFWTGGLSEDAWWIVSAVATPLSGWVMLMMLLGVLWSQPARTPISKVMRAVAAILASLLILGIVGAICLYPLRFAVIAPQQQFGINDFEGAYLNTTIRLGCSLAVLFAVALLGYALSVWLPALISGDPAASIPRLPLRVRCPRCQQWQHLQTGGDHCLACGLRITVTPT